MKATVTVDTQYTRVLIVELEADTDMESLLFDFLDHATVEKRDADSANLIIKLSDEDAQK